MMSIKPKKLSVRTKYIVLLKDNWYCFGLTPSLKLFLNGDRLFDLKGATEFIEWAERAYPKNKGRYKIFELKEIKKDKRNDRST